MAYRHRQADLHRLRERRLARAEDIVRRIKEHLTRDQRLIIEDNAGAVVARFQHWNREGEVLSLDIVEDEELSKMLSEWE